ncbi:MAG: cache domain-containing protein, partial [Ruminiclostridium sp.]|nr:cache domain-containing protein [Ruminiclostridium sp.]
TEKLIYCADNSFFCHIAFVDDDGRTCMNGEMEINPRVYAGSSLTGSMNVAPGANIYSVPVHSSSGSVIGTLVGKLEDNAAANASFKAYGVSGVTYILNTDGTIINCSNNTASGIAAGDNLITVLSDENDINLIRTHLSQNDVSDSFKVTYKDEEYILAMTSLDTQAWTLVSLVPCSAVIDFYSNITAPLNYMIFGLTAVFVILAGYLFYFTHRVRKTAEGIIDENNKINYVDDITGYSSWKSFM